MVFRRKRKRHRVDIGDHKFCPVCGSKLELHDTYCTRCGYSFAQRHRRKRNKKIKWRNIIIFLIIIAILYVTFTLATGQELIPEFITEIADSFQNLTSNKTS